MADVDLVVTVDDSDGTIVKIESRKEATMAKTNFTWLGDTTFTRSFGAKPPSKLEKGKTYPVEGFPVEVVDEWVRTGNAKYAGAKPDKEV